MAEESLVYKALQAEYEKMATDQHFQDQLHEQLFKAYAQGSADYDDEAV